MLPTQLSYIIPKDVIPLCQRKTFQSWEVLHSSEEVTKIEAATKMPSMLCLSVCLSAV